MQHPSAPTCLPAPSSSRPQRRRIRSPAHNCARTLSPAHDCRHGGRGGRGGDAARALRTAATSWTCAWLAMPAAALRYMRMIHSARLPGRCRRRWAACERRPRARRAAPSTRLTPTQTSTRPQRLSNRIRSRALAETRGSIHASPTSRCSSLQAAQEHIMRSVTGAPCDCLRNVVLTLLEYPTPQVRARNAGRSEQDERRHPAWCSSRHQPSLQPTERRRRRA